MNDKLDDEAIPKSTVQGELLKPTSSLNEIRMVGEVLTGLVAPFAKAQETAAIEETKRVEIDADVTKKFHLGLFALATLAFVLAGLALFKGDSTLTQQIVIAVLSFLGGYGFGKNAE